MAKRRKAKVPKRIAGVKLPKGMRKAARPLARAAANPLAREILAGAIVAAAVAAWRDERVRAAAGRMRDDAQRWLRRTATQALGPVQDEPGGRGSDEPLRAMREAADDAQSVYGLEPDAAVDDDRDVDREDWRRAH